MMIEEKEYYPNEDKSERRGILGVQPGDGPNKGVRKCQPGVIEQLRVLFPFLLRRSWRVISTNEVTKKGFIVTLVFQYIA